MSRVVSHIVIRCDGLDVRASMFLNAQKIADAAKKITDALRRAACLDGSACRTDLTFVAQMENAAPKITEALLRKKLACFDGADTYDDRRHWLLGHLRRIGHRTNKITNLRALRAPT